MEYRNSNKKKRVHHSFSEVQINATAISKKTEYDNEYPEDKTQWGKPE